MTANAFPLWFVLIVPALAQNPAKCCEVTADNGNSGFLGTTNDAIMPKVMEAAGHLQKALPKYAPPHYSRDKAARFAMSQASATK